MSELVEKYLSEVEALARPISEAEPQGADLSYEADFEVVRNEIDKLTTLAGETPNWREVVSNGEELVSTKSKDLRLLLWATAGRLRTDGITGLARGLAGIKVVCEAHWDSMYPPAKRAKARGNLATWLGDQVTPILTEYQPKLGDGPVLEAIGTLYNDIDELFSTKLGDAYSGMGPLRSLLRDKTRDIPADAPPPPPPAPVAAPAPAAPAAAPAEAPAAAPAMAAPTVPTVTGAADALPALRALGKGVADAARHIRNAEPTSGWAFRLARLGTWLAVKQAPPAEGGKTKIPPPQAADTKKLQSLVEAQQWPQLVAAGEELAGRFLFWLDAHRYVALGLERQGPLFQEARDAVTAQVLDFVKHHPQIPSLAFADGTPFADEGTKTWLEEEQAKVGGGGGGGGGGSQQLDEEEQELKARFEEARELVTGGKVGEGLGLAMQLARRGSDARARYRARLEIAAMALKGGKADLARPVLEGLVIEAATHGLEHWEPELAARTYEMLLKARVGAGGRGAANPPDQEVFDRLCRLDPAAALKVAP